MKSQKWYAACAAWYTVLSHGMIYTSLRSVYDNIRFLYARRRISSVPKRNGYHWKKPDSSGRQIRFLSWWERMDSNHRSWKQQIYSLPPLATRERFHLSVSVTGNIPASSAEQYIFRADTAQLELVDGLEPPTCWLQISCSTNWATPAFNGA